MELKDLRVAVLPARVGDQNIDFFGVIKLNAIRSDVRIIPITDYFQMLNDEELNPTEQFTFLLDMKNEVILNGTNIEGIHQHEYSGTFVQGSEITNAETQLKSGMEVVEKDGYIGVVYHVYSPTEVSLCLVGYEGRDKEDMHERDWKTNIEDIRIPKS